MKKLCIVLVLATISQAGWTHNTNVTHPIISLEANRLIEKKDATRRYPELYRKEKSLPISGAEYPYFWGVWNSNDWRPGDPGIPFRIYSKLKVAEDDADQFGYQKIFGANNFNVIRGVVREDVPDPKVLTHFYHAYTAGPLTFVVPSPNRGLAPSRIAAGKNSRDRAVEWFVRAVNEYDYETDLDFRRDDWLTLTAAPTVPPFAKQLAFQTFGEALHHVEDMSSIAHVQNDAHLTKEHMAGQENDDYEAIFLVHRIFQFFGAEDNPLQANTNWFTTGTNIPRIESVEQIWPAPSAAIDWTTESLARKIYNASLFQGKLTPSSLPEAIASWSSGKFSEGEIADMFQDKIHYNRRQFWELPVWTIDGVGDYHFLGPDWGFFPWKDAWWPTAEFGGPPGYFYIEQKIVGEWQADGSNFAVAPGGIRKSLLSAYDPNGENGLSTEDGGVLLTRFAKVLVPLAVEYAAGFSEYWFDIANPPPYLKAVKVKQKAISVVTPESAGDEYEFTAYDAHWQNGHGILRDTRSSLYEGVTDMHAVFTAERKLKREKPTQPLYRDHDMQILLQFSESIAAPLGTTGRYDSSSEFKIGFQYETARGRVQGTEVMLPMADTNAVEIESIMSMGDDDTDSMCAKPHMENSCWKVTVKGTALAAIPGLFGAVRLIVFAKDNNNHRDSDGKLLTNSPIGAYLDGEPQTPAKRKATLLSDGKLKFDWYDGSIPLSAEFTNSGASPSSFSYEYQKGDRTNILWFSHKTDPAAQESATAGQGYSTVTITSMPKRDTENVFVAPH